MSSRIRRWLPLLALLQPLVVPEAGAIVLGPIRSDSRVGEVVRAEVAIEEHPAERFDPACLRLYRPPSASDDQAWLTAARLSYRRQGGRSQLDIVSLARLNEPVVHIGVRSQCADGATRSYTLSLAAAAARASVQAPRSAAQTPSTAAGETHAEPLAAAEPAATASAAAEVEAPLQLSDELSVSGQSSNLGRELWRLEHRTLEMLNDTNDDQRALDEKLAWLEANVAELKRAGDRLAEKAAALPSPAPTSVARSSAAASRPAEASPPVWMGAEPWPLYVGLTGGLLLVLLLVFRRRAAAREEQSSGPLTLSAPVLDEPRLSSVEEGEKALVSIETPAAITIHPATTRSATPAAVVPPPPATEAELGGAAPALELAEIMLTFGRVSGAAKTLEEYLASEPQESLRPWIRLLQIYQHHDMRDEFEAMTLKLNRNFNVEIIRWDGGEARQDLELVPLEGIDGKAMTLEEIPRIRDQIISLWGKPGCTDYLEKLLRDNREGQRRGFSLPVAEEVLFLIDLAAAREAAR
ncbi:MAG: hypothetical protein V5B36_15805 [Candidatus Accumulibacter sp. UW25]|jgi:pilus assembly protein FimV